MSVQYAYSRPLSLAFRSQLLFATSISILALTAVGAGAQTSGSQAQQLPPVTVTPPAAAKTKAAPGTQEAPAADTASQAASNPATALGSYNPALDLRGLQLPPGTVLTTAGPVQGYRALSTMSATKTATPIEQIPQSIGIVPRSVLNDQGALTVADAVRNVSGVQPTNVLQTPAYDSTLIRGFPAEQWLDGMTVYYNVGARDSLVNTERLEVLKGPAAVLYGGGAGAPVGGAINVISKLPTNQASGEVGITVGSHKLWQPYFDINQPLDKSGKALFRITGEYKSSESFIDDLENKTYAINPTLVLTNKDDTTLTIQGRFNRWSGKEYQGLPAIGTVAGNFRIDRDLFIGPSNVPNSFSSVNSVTVTLDHKFNAYVDGSVKVRASKQEFAESAQSIVGTDSFQANVPFAGSTWGLTNVYLSQEQNEVSINPNLRIRFGAGPSQNTVLIGADHTRLTDKGILTSDFFLGGAGTVDLTHPAFPTPYARPVDSLFTTFQRPDNVYTIQGAYAQMQSTLFDRVHLLGGLRLAHIEIDYVDPVAGADLHTDTSKVLPRIGGVVDVLPGLSVFASYSEGLKANPFTIFVGQPEPEESKQKEVGFKFKFASQLSGTLAVFDLERSKVPIAVGGGFASAPIGEQRSRGVEADVVWQPGGNVKVLANYAYVDAELTRATSTAAAGNGLIGVPQHSGRVWVNYGLDDWLPKGWSVGAGIYAASSSFVDLPNRYKTAGYYTVDGKVAYETDKYTAALYVTNLTGEEYFVPYNYFGGRVAPGPDRTFYSTFAVKY